MKKKILVALFAALVIVCGQTPSADAATHHKVRTIVLAGPTHTVQHHKIRHFEKLARGRALVAFNDGSVVIFRPCPLEDSPRCWWDAGTSGNGIGHSFVQYHRHTYYLDRIVRPIR
jgi:hypothetical protein